tara:strand:- start:20 stop:196 length:177 start_codon:yes stop_codon:yes gene_type:complete
MSNPHNDIIRESLSKDVEDMKVKEIFDLINSNPSIGDHSDFAKMIANIIEHKFEHMND